MAIKDRDGKVFTLRGPNPAMLHQQQWDAAKLVFHNMFFPTITMSAQRFFTPDLIDLDPLPAPVEAGQPQSPSPDREPSHPPQSSKIFADRKIRLLCLPASRESHFDSLYGSNYSRTAFGQKVSIEGILISLEDLLLDFWTEKSIMVKSIVFPTQMEMKRWWQVEECSPQSGGFVVSCSPSVLSPDFSD